ncbi:hypothetical protein BsWGS_28048 [Bradybaena similaris]
MIRPISASVTKKKEAMQKWIRDRVDYSREAERKPYTFHRDISFLDCQLPCVAALPQELRYEYIRSVVDEDMKMDLENCHAINWLPQAIKLTPVIVPRDGNCLLHAASMAVWGVEDSRNTLRDLMLMTIKINHNFKKRWWNQLMKDLQSLDINESEIIEQEWDDVIRSISDLGSSVTSAAVPHRFLEGIHIYILANILRRPIIIVTESNFRSMAGHHLQENCIGGLYLPLEWTPLECCKTPIVLGYSLNHFCPLLSETEPGYSASLQEKKTAHLFPLVTSDLGFLLVRYLKDKEELQVSDLVQSYLLVKEVNTSDAVTKVPFVQMHLRPLEQGQNSLFEHLMLLKKILKGPELLKTMQGHIYLNAAQQSNHPFYDIEMSSQTEVVPVRHNFRYPGGSRDTPHLHNQEQQQNATGKCIAEGCTKRGSDKLNNLCFHCYRITSQAIIPQDKNIKLISENTVNTIEGQAVTPTAPPMSLEAPSDDHQPLSMMVERCITGCGYRCSQQTYPYCHECSQLKAQELEHNVAASSLCHSSKILESRPPEGPKGVSDFETSDINCIHILLPSSVHNSSSLSSSEPSWLQESENLSQFFDSPGGDESKPLSKSGSETLMDKNCKHFDCCSGVKMLDHDVCFSCAQNEKSAKINGTNAEAETNPDRLRKRIMIMAEANAEFSLEGVATSFAETNIGSISGDLEVSEEPPGKVECPYCRTIIFQQDKLCSKCTSILQKAYEQKREMNQTTLSTASDIQPAKVNMSHRENARLLLDSRHSGKLASNQKTKGKLEDHSRGLEIPHSTSKLNPHLSQGKHCITAKCPNYGDPLMDNKCSSCFYNTNPFEKPLSALKAEKTTKSTFLYPRQDASEKPANKKLSKHSAYKQQTEQLPYAQQKHRSTLGLQSEYSSGAKTAPVIMSPFVADVMQSHSQTFQQVSPESSLELTTLRYPEAKDVMVTSKTGHNSFASLHPLSEHSSLQPLPEHSSYSFNRIQDRSFEKAIQAIEVNVKKNVKKCLSSHCSNYGNSCNKGYCNSCFKVIRKQRILEREAKYGIDVPDS